MKQQLSPKVIIGVVAAMIVIVVTVFVIKFRSGPAGNSKAAAASAVKRRGAGPGNGIPAAMEPTGLHTFTPPQ